VDREEDSRGVDRIPAVGTESFWITVLHADTRHGFQDFENQSLGFGVENAQRSDE